VALVVGGDPKPLKWPLNGIRDLLEADIVHENLDEMTHLDGASVLPADPSKALVDGRLEAVINLQGDVDGLQRLEAAVAGLCVDVLVLPVDGDVEVAYEPSTLFTSE
jgi:hypothetical protein